jgi:hypothetical protein
MCSRRALEEFAGLDGDSIAPASTSDVLAAFAFAMCSRRADDLEIFRAVVGVFFTAPSRLGDGLSENVKAVPGGDIAFPKTPPKEGRDFGVRATILLLDDKGRGLGVD